MTRAVALFLVVAACAPRPGEPPAGGGSAPVFFAGDELGYLEPCGCTRPQLGGLKRKGTAVAGAILLEGGNLVERPGRLSEIKYESFLTALSAIGCRALNVGERDLALGIDFLRSAAGLATFPLISANVLDAAGAPVFPTFADFTVDGLPFRAIGALDPSLAPGHRVADPAEAVGKALEGLPPDARAVLLFCGAEAPAAALAERYPRLLAVSFAKSGGEPLVRNPRLFSPGDRSRWMVRLDDAPAVLELAESIPDHPAMTAALADYVRRLEAEDLLHRMNPRAPPSGGGYAGDAVCATCHIGAMKVHGNTRHAQAIRSLARTGRDIDPDCVTCHVTGYGEATGFLSVRETPALARVGCESCHGPAADHTRGKGKPPRDVKAGCRECHNGDTDPYFSFDAKWARIRH